MMLKHKAAKKHHSNLYITTMDSSDENLPAQQHKPREKPKLCHKEKHPPSYKSGGCKNNRLIKTCCPGANVSKTPPSQLYANFQLSNKFTCGFSTKETNSINYTDSIKIYGYKNGAKVSGMNFQSNRNYANTETLYGNLEDPGKLSDTVKIYTDWANHYLEKAQKTRLIKDLQKDMQDSVLLIDIVEAVISEKIPDVRRNPKSADQALENIHFCIQHLSTLGIALDGVLAKDISEGQLKSILSLFFSLSRYKQQQKSLNKLACGSASTNKAVKSELQCFSGASKSTGGVTVPLEMMSKLPSPFRPMSGRPHSGKGETQEAALLDAKAIPSSSRCGNIPEKESRLTTNQISAPKNVHSAAKHGPSLVHESSSLPHRPKEPPAPSKLPSGPNSRKIIGQGSPKVAPKATLVPVGSAGSRPTPGGGSLPQPGFSSLKRPSSAQRKDNKMLDKFKLFSSKEKSQKNTDSDSGKACSSFSAKRPPVGSATTSCEPASTDTVPGSAHQWISKFSTDARLPKSSTRHSNSSSGFSSARSELSDVSVPTVPQHKSSLPTTVGPGSIPIISSPKIQAKKSSCTQQATKNLPTSASEDAPSTDSSKISVETRQTRPEPARINSPPFESSSMPASNYGCNLRQKVTSPSTSQIPSFGSLKGGIPKPTMAVKGMKPVATPSQGCQATSIAHRPGIQSLPNNVNALANSSSNPPLDNSTEISQLHDLSGALHEKLRQTFYAQRSHSNLSCHVGSPNAVVGVVSPLTHHKKSDRPVFSFADSEAILNEAQAEPCADSDPERQTGGGHQSDSSGTQSDTAGSVIFRPFFDHNRSSSPEIGPMILKSPSAIADDPARKMRALSISPARTQSRLETTFDSDDGVVVTQSLPPFGDTMGETPLGLSRGISEELQPMQPLIPRSTPYAYLKNASEKMENLACEESFSKVVVMRAKSPKLLMNRQLASLLNTKLATDEIGFMPNNKRTSCETGGKANVASLAAMTSAGYMSDGDALQIPEHLDFDLTGYVSEGGVSLFARKLQARFKEGIEAVQKSMGRKISALEDNFEDSSSLSSGVSENFDEISTDDLTGSSLSDQALNFHSNFCPSRSIPRRTQHNPPTTPSPKTCQIYSKSESRARKFDTGQQTEPMVNGFSMVGNNTASSTAESGSKSVSNPRKLSADQYDPQRINQLLQKCRTSSRGMGTVTNNTCNPQSTNQHRPKSEQLAVDGPCQFSLSQAIGQSRIGDTIPEPSPSPYRRIGPLLSSTSSAGYGLVGYGNVPSNGGNRLGYGKGSGYNFMHGTGTPGEPGYGTATKMGYHSLDRKKHLMYRVAPNESSEPSSTTGETSHSVNLLRSTNQGVPSSRDAALLAMLSPRHVAMPKTTNSARMVLNGREFSPDEQDIMDSWTRHTGAQTRNNCQPPMITLTVANGASTMSQSLIEPEVKLSAGLSSNISSTSASCHERVSNSGGHYSMLQHATSDSNTHKHMLNAKALQLTQNGSMVTSQSSNGKHGMNHHVSSRSSLSGKSCLGAVEMMSPTTQLRLQNLTANGSNMLANLTSPPNGLLANRQIMPGTYNTSAEKFCAMEEVHGSTLSIASSNSSAYSNTAEERYQSEIRKLHREVDIYKEKVQTLTTQQSTYAHVVAAFEQSLTSMTKRVQSLTAVSEQKESEVSDLKSKIDTLRQMSIAVGLNIDEILCSPSPNFSRRHTINSNGPPPLTRQLSSESMNSTNSQRSSLSGSNKTTSSKLSMHLTPNVDKKGKKSWPHNLEMLQLRSSFSKAFSKQKKNKCGSISDIEEGPTYSMADILNPSSPAHSARTPSQNSSILNGSPNTSADMETVSLLKKELNRKDSTLTEVRLDALTSAQQVDQMKEMLMRLKNEVEALKSHNNRLQNIVSRKTSENNVRPTSQNSLPLLNDEVDRDSVSDGGNVVSEFCCPTSGVDAMVNDNAQGFRMNVAVNINRTESNQENFYTLIGSVCLSYKAKWNLLDAVISKIFKEYVLRIDQVSNLGLSSESILQYDVAGIQRYISDSNAATKLSPSSLFDQNKTNIVKVTLKNFRQNSVDALAFETLVPKSILQRYVSLLHEHRRIVFCGSADTGKTFLIKKLAEHIVSRCEGSSIVSFDVRNHSDNDELKNYLLKLVKIIQAMENSATKSPIPTVILIDDMQNILSMGDMFAPLLNVPPQACPYIIGAMKQPNSSTTDLQLYHNFRWVLSANHMEPVKGFLSRYLRRRQIECEVNLGARLSPELTKILDWLPKLWSQLNKFLEAINSCEATVGPSIFMDCPLDGVKSRDWFTHLWNTNLLPYLQQCCNEGLQMFGRRLSFEDPNDFILKTWPWSGNPTPGSCLSRLKIDLSTSPEDDVMSCESFASDAEGDPLIMLMKLKEQAKRQREKDIESMSSYQPNGIKATL